LKIDIFFRNDILVVVSLIISLKLDAPGKEILSSINLIKLFFIVIETGFAKQLLLYASYPECK
jgi:hypothetical protein